MYAPLPAKNSCPKVDVRETKNLDIYYLIKRHLHKCQPVSSLALKVPNYLEKRGCSAKQAILFAGNWYSGTKGSITRARAAPVIITSTHT
jgi:hypothetical protein